MLRRGVGKLFYRYSCSPHSLPLQAVLFVSGLVVGSPLSRSPWTWRLCGLFVIASTLTTVIVLLTQTAEIRSAHYVFFHYENQSGESSRAYVYLIGWALTCFASGLEACAHIAEDTMKPSRTVPLAMFWSTALSYILGWMSICVLLAVSSTVPSDAEEQTLTATHRRPPTRSTSTQPSNPQSRCCPTPSRAGTRP